MRTVVANAMLFLLILLSVGTARCEVRCTAMSMPVSAAAPAAAAPEMEHCVSMQPSADESALMDSACSSSLCSHQVLPASLDYSADAARHFDSQFIGRHVDVIAFQVPERALPFEDARPPLLLRSPLEQSSTFRV